MKLDCDDSNSNKIALHVILLCYKRKNANNSRTHVCSKSIYDIRQNNEVLESYPDQIKIVTDVMMGFQ